MDFYEGRHNHQTDERDIKWSNCTWGDNINFETNPLPSKPGPNDHASSRYGHFTLNIDVDVNVLSLSCGDGSQNIAKGRNIRTKRNMGISIATFNSGESAMIYEKCNVEVGGSFNFTFWHEAKGAGIGRLSLTDTKMTVKGDLTSAIPANPLIQNGARAGVIIEVAGKTQLSFNGGAVIYLRRIILSDTEESLKLQVGRNCPYAIIWNGETLTCKDDFCNFTPENEHFAVAIKKGENELIVKMCRMNDDCKVTVTFTENANTPKHYMKLNSSIKR